MMFLQPISIGSNALKRIAEPVPEAASQAATFAPKLMTEMTTSEAVTEIQIELLEAEAQAEAEAALMQRSSGSVGSLLSIKV